MIKKQGTISAQILEDDGAILSTVKLDDGNVRFKNTDAIYKGSNDPYYKMQVNVIFDANRSNVLAIEPAAKLENTKAADKNPAKQSNAVERFKAEKLPNGSDIIELPDRSPKKYIWYAGVAAIAVAYWIVKGTPEPSLFFAGSSAKENCLRLAEENKGKMFLIGNGDITANDTWVKDGKRVVQLLQESPDGMRQIMCLYGNGMVSIPSALEQGRWR